MVARIRIGKREKEAAEWAIEAMPDFVDEGESDFGHEDIPKTECGCLIIPNTSRARNAIEDLIYRINEQLPDVAEGATDDEEEDARAVVRAGHRLAEKLRTKISCPRGTS